MRKIFNNAEEVFAYYANLNGDFKVVEDAFKDLKTTNVSLTEELAKTKIENMQMKVMGQQTITQLADTKIRLMQLENKLNGGK